MIISIFPIAIREKTLRERDIMVVVFQLPMQSVPITIDAVRSNLDQDEVYNIMWIKFVSAWRHNLDQD